MPKKKSLEKNPRSNQRSLRSNPRSDRSTLYKLIVIIIRRIVYYANSLLDHIRRPRNRNRNNIRVSTRNSIRMPTRSIRMPSMNNLRLPTNMSYSSRRLVIGVLVVVVILVVAVAIISSDNTQEEDTPELPVITTIADTDMGTVYKDGPYGNTSSDVKIAFILGVHPRENGSHVLMEEALKSQQGDLRYCYYLYHVNVTQDSRDFRLSRDHGQNLANQYVVGDIINNNFTLAMDIHYSDGSWGVERFMFTSVEDDALSNDVSHAVTDNFDWITYYTPKNPSSPEYVMTPLINGGVPTVLYEAYTRDDNNLTLEHDKEIIRYIDNYNFTPEA